MTEPLAFLNGRFFPAGQLAVPVYDAGFVQGVTVAEQLRTFGGRLFRLEAHLRRLAHSLATIGVAIEYRPAELAAVAEKLVQHNRALLAPGDDVGLSLFVTPGAYAAFAPAQAEPGPLVAAHTYPVPFGSFAAKYEQGEKLATTSIVQTPPECWPASLKCRSRMHYYLADQEARQRFPGARALLCNAAGQVAEASTANVLAYFAGEGLVSPPRSQVLAGISLETIGELAGQLNIPFSERNFSAAELATARECLLCSTSPCVLPVCELNGQPLGTGKPGPLFGQLLAAWSKLVGFDIAAQARQFARRV